jgi:hypothetical protein
MKLSYALSEILKHGTDRTWWRSRLLSRVVSRYYATRENSGTRLVNEDWDNAIILDACRYDLFEETYNEFDIKGELRKRTSLESATPGFLHENFGDETFHDLVYVSANPYISTELAASQFHDIVHVWKDGWDDDLETVTPETMYEATVEAASKYPEKRILSHFIQPHTPFIGKHRIGERDHFTIRDRALGNESTTRRTRTPFERLEIGDLTYEDVWRAYRSNLERALSPTADLLDSLDGKTVVTSDHGNAMGEHAAPFPIKVYGHPMGIRIPALTHVPYFEASWDSRKTITAEVPVKSEGEDTDIQERLRSLGYVE